MAVSATSVPRFAPHVVFRYDERRARWIVLAPERLFMPDDIAVEILKCCDGKRAVSAIAEQLAARFETHRAVVEQDVTAMLQDLVDQGVVEA